MSYLLVVDCLTQHFWLKTLLHAIRHNLGWDEASYKTVWSVLMAIVMTNNGPICNISAFACCSMHYWVAAFRTLLVWVGFPTKSFAELYWASLQSRMDVHSTHHVEGLGFRVHIANDASNVMLCSKSGSHAPTPQSPADPPHPHLLPRRHSGNALHLSHSHISRADITQTLEYRKRKFPTCKNRWIASAQLATSDKETLMHKGTACEWNAKYSTDNIRW